MAASRRHLSSALSHVARSLINSHVSPASPSPSPSSSSSYGLSKPPLLYRHPWLLSHGFQNSFSSPSPLRPLGDSRQTRQMTSTAKTSGKGQKSGPGGETGKGETGKGEKPGEGGNSRGGGGGEEEEEKPVDPFKDTLPPQPIPSDFFSNPNSTAISVDDDEDMESLLLNRDLKGIPGLPPPKELRAFDQSAEERAERREMERLKQEQIFRSRIRLVDDFGRSYATGRRKCSVARVWLREGEGQVAVNNMSYDLYFPELEWRARLLQPFVVTETLGSFDVKATVTGGGRAGQAGAIRLGISRALQLFTPELRPSLKAAGFLTRDARVVERKKPGKAKARKSFTWVKR